MRPSIKPRGFPFPNAQLALLGILILTLVFTVSCKKKDPQSASGIESHQAATGTSYLPQDVFGPDAVPGATQLKPIGLHSLSETEMKYGIAPQRAGTVEYQPEVIVMQHGDKAIRSVASNGMKWEFDANAEHVREFQEGKIVFATGRAVGRIISLKREGDSVKAILGPIQLTDVIKNGKFKMDSPISADNVISFAEYVAWYKQQLKNFHYVHKVWDNRAQELFYSPDGSTGVGITGIPDDNGVFAVAYMKFASNLTVYQEDVFSPSNPGCK